jgi:hypothetical protein
MSTQTIDMTPTWETAASIYCMVLENPDADASAKENARDEIIRLARAFDDVQKLVWVKLFAKDDSVDEENEDA